MGIVCDFYFYTTHYLCARYRVCVFYLKIYYMHTNNVPQRTSEFARAQYNICKPETEEANERIQSHVVHMSYIRMVSASSFERA